MKILFTIVSNYLGDKNLFYKEVSWPKDTPLPRVGEKLSLGNLFPCEITDIFWEIDSEDNDPVSLHVFMDFKDTQSALHQSVFEGYLKEIKHQP